MPVWFSLFCYEIALRLWFGYSIVNVCLGLALWCLELTAGVVYLCLWLLGFELRRVFGDFVVVYVGLVASVFRILADFLILACRYGLYCWLPIVCCVLDCFACLIVLVSAMQIDVVCLGVI